MTFEDLRTLCSIYKIVVHYEIVFTIVAAIIAIGKTQGMSLVVLVLFLLLAILPQYIIVEMGLLVDKLAKNQNQAED